MRSRSLLVAASLTAVLSNACAERPATQKPLRLGSIHSAANPTLSPAAVTLAQAATQQFTATGTGPYTWALQVSPSGSIDSSGLYTAGSPGSAGATDTVTVTDTGASNTTATATVTISKGVNAFSNGGGSNGVIAGNGFPIQNNTRVVMRAAQTFQAAAPVGGATTAMVTLVAVDMIRAAGGAGQNIKAEIHSLTGSGGIDDQGASNAFSSGTISALTALPSLNLKTRILIPMTPGTALTVGTSYALTLKTDVAGTLNASVSATPANDPNGGVAWWYSKRYHAGGWVSRGIFTSSPADYTKDTSHNLSGNVFMGEVYTAPTASSLGTTSAMHGASGITLTVNGTNFFAASTVNWNGSARTTTYVSATRLTAAILTADLNTAGTYPVTVTTPAPGGGTSSAQNFTVSAGNGDIITTFAGGDNPPASTLATNWAAGNVSAVARDSSGNAYYADATHHTVFSVDSSGNVHRFAGNDSLGFSGDGGAAVSAALNCSYAGSNLMCTLTTDSSGNVYITDRGNVRVRMVPAATGSNFGQSMTANYIYTIAGGGGGGDGAAATSASIDPYASAVDSSGNLFIADRGNHRIRMVPRTTATFFGQSMTANYIYTVAGNGTNAFAGDSGLATSGSVSYPYGLAVDGAGNIYVADTGNSRIRMIAKTTATFFGQSMTANNIYTIAGNGSTTFAGDAGAATSAAINQPLGVVVDSAGHVYIADYNNRIRMVAKTTGTYFSQSMTANNIYTIAGTGGGGSTGDGGLATSGQLFPYSIGVDSSGNVYGADSTGNRVRMIPAATGTYFGQSMTGSNIYTMAGNGSGGFTGDGLDPTVGGLYEPLGLTVDSSDNVYIADQKNYRIRLVPKTTGTYFGQSMTANKMYTIAGNGTWASSGDGSAATSGSIASTSGVALDSSGNVYISDQDGHRIRMVPKTTGTYFGQSMTANSIYTIAGNGSHTLGDGGLATSGGLFWPEGLTVDTSGNVFIADQGDNRVRMIPKTSGTYFGQSMTANYIYTVAGNGTATFAGDAGAATSASLNTVQGVATDSAGNLYIADRLNNRIRMVPVATGSNFGISMTANYIYTIAGGGPCCSLGDGGLATSGGLNSPGGLTIDTSGNVIVADMVTHRVRMIPKVTGSYFTQSMTANYIYTIAGNGTNAFAGDSGTATSGSLYNPIGVGLDSTGNLYVVDYSNNRIRIIQ